MSAFRCDNVSPDCPVENSIYGYYPSLPANAFFVAFFGVCLGAQLALGFRYKTWTFLVALGFTCLSEVIGYIGRIILHNNPFSNVGFEMQICCLILGPAFTSAGIYLLLKHVVIDLGPEYSRLQPRYYTWIFICCDIFSLILQGVGGGLAATSDRNFTQLNAGSNLMLAGIVLQVFTLLVFGILAATYLFRVQANKSFLEPEATLLLRSTKFRIFMGGILFAYTTILIRCIYRIPELSGGWESAIMQNETDFIVLDGVMVACATLALTLFHPGYWFPSMKNHGTVSEKQASPSGSVQA